MSFDRNFENEQNLGGTAEQNLGGSLIEILPLKFRRVQSCTTCTQVAVCNPCTTCTYVFDDVVVVVVVVIVVFDDVVVCVRRAFL